jgi:phytoene/squalene synthetase
MKALYDRTADYCSKLITNKYSTSFSLGIRMLDKSIRMPIYGIYGFVRVADEIVDSFHEYDKKTLLDEFVAETYAAIDRGISTNPVLHSFQHVVRTYNIEREHIQAFFDSMYKDLEKRTYSAEEYDAYIYGSAQVVGLMCLKVFCSGDQSIYDDLKAGAEALGAAFQKVNFLRDYKADKDALGRAYFPNIDFDGLNISAKKAIEEDIEKDFKRAKTDILRLPKCARFGVYTAYLYYYLLFRKIQNSPLEEILDSRVRINNFNKLMLLPVSKVDLHLQNYSLYQKMLRNF